MQAEERKVNKVGTVVAHYATFSENQFSCLICTFQTHSTSAMIKWCH